MSLGLPLIGQDARGRRAKHARALLALALGPACSAAAEPARVEVVVLVDGDALVPSETDLGYEVELSEARLVVRDFTFASAGETHAMSLSERLLNVVISPAQAHPGHHQAGGIIGQMPGQYIIDWLAPEQRALGSATMLVGTYASANFTFDRAQHSEVASNDELLGHTARLSGVARKQGLEVPFEAMFKAPDARDLVGVPCVVTVDEDSRLRLLFQLSLVDEVEGDTLFDKIDFAGLVGDGENAVELSEDSSDEAGLAAFNQIQRTFQTHDHFSFKALDD